MRRKKGIFVYILSGKIVMRVIAGKARRLPLKTIEGEDTRPTTDRIKETLFNILQADIPDSYFLDLFSGSGAIGIEALSRGAKKAYFVEKNKKAAECIRRNLEFTKLQENAVVMECDCLTAIRRLEGKDILFDVVYMDPPYRMEYEIPVLTQLYHSSIIGKDTKILLEAALDTRLSEEELGFIIEREKTYKTNKHIFLRKL